MASNSSDNSNQGGGSCSCGYPFPNSVCPDHAPWNQPKAK